MGGVADKVSQSGRRPLPQPPVITGPTSYCEPPPPYTESTLRSVAPPTTKSSCPLQQIWKAFVDRIRSLYHFLISAFQKKKLPIPEKAIVEDRTLAVGQQHVFTFDGCEQLVYLVGLNEERDLELLGFHFVTVDEGGGVEHKQIGQLDASEREIALTAIGQIESAAFKTMLEALLQWARENNFHGTVVRKIDATDVAFIVEYDALRFEIELNPDALEVFTKDMQALKSRLEVLLFKKDGRHKTFWLHRFLEQENEDIVRFRRMLSCLIGENGQPIDGSTVDFKQLHQYWCFWEKGKFLPEHQIAIYLDQGEEVPPAFYQGRLILSPVVFANSSE